MKLVREFKQFVLRGNVVDLAVGIVIGVAFTELVNSFVTNLVTPLIGAVGGLPDLSDRSFEINGSAFTYGEVVNQLLSFLLTALVVFFFVVKPINLLVTRARKQASPDPTTTRCSFCRLEIPIDATRCPNCTSELRHTA